MRRFRRYLVKKILQLVKDVLEHSGEAAAPAGAAFWGAGATAGRGWFGAPPLGGRCGPFAGFGRSVAWLSGRGAVLLRRDGVFDRLHLAERRAAAAAAEFALFEA